MVNVEKGLLVSSDPAMIQFLKHLDEERTIQPTGSFIVRELDSKHVLVKPQVKERLEKKIDSLMDSLTPDIQSN